MSFSDEYAALKATTTIDDCRVIEVPKTLRPEGNLSFIEGLQNVPFNVERVYYLYDVPGGACRGGHAHKELQQLIISIMGAFDVVLDDSYKRKVVTLNRAYNGLYVPRLIWRELENFSSGGVCLVLASLPYDRNDYIYNYNEFVRIKNL
jgi:hypothetical protein